MIKNRKNFSSKPSGSAEKMLRRLVPRSEWEALCGDFREIYQEEGSNRGRLGGLWCWMQVVFYIPRFMVRQIHGSCMMIRSYWMAAFRSIKKQRMFALVNFSGIAIGMSACFILYNYVVFERSYDRFHKNADSLYRLTNDRYKNETLIQHGVITYPSVAKTMAADFPEVLNYTRLDLISPVLVSMDDFRFEETVLLADSAFFSMFSFPLVQGDARTVLAEPYSICLSAERAFQYFGDEWKNGILGRVLTIDNRIRFTVTGVFEDLPENSHMQFDLVASYSTLGNVYGNQVEDSWTNSNFWSYLQLRPGADPIELERKFEDFSAQYFRGSEVTGYFEKFYLQPLRDIHLCSDYEYELWNHGNKEVVDLLFGIALFILLIAWINYININTARSLERAKAVCMRTVLGAVRRQIVSQFLVEALIFGVSGMLFATVIVTSLQPALGSALGIQFPMLVNFGSLLVLASIFLTVTLFAGLCTAWLITSFPVIEVLRGMKNRGRGRLLRNVLVVFQFVLSFGLISGTMAVYRQIEFMMDQDLGMNIDRILVLSPPRLSNWDETYYRNIEAFKSDLKGHAGIVNVATSTRIPGRQTGRIFNVRLMSGQSDLYTTADISADKDYFSTFEMKLLAGRFFDASDHHYSFRDISSAIINQSTAQLMGFAQPADAVGERLQFWGQEWNIVGVVADHHFQSMRSPVEPVIFTPYYSTHSNIFVRFNTDDIPGLFHTIEGRYKHFFPDNKYDAFFLDAFFDEQYNADRRFRSLMGIFSFLGVFLACLGLFGLSFFMVSQRTKEIGIRKAMGASVGSILILLYRSISRLVLLAALIASPVLYFIIKSWLEHYSVRFRLDVWNFTLPCICLVLIAWLTISFNTFRAARMNPVGPLRSE